MWESLLSFRYFSSLVSLFPEYPRPTGSSVVGDRGQDMVALEEHKSLFSRKEAFVIMP